MTNQTRPLKFRMWDEEAQTMDYRIRIGSLISYTDEVMDYQTAMKKLGGSFDLNKAIASIPTLMQYTGIKDKNGNEIYEGDIVEAIYGYDLDGYVSVKGAVTFQKCQWLIENFAMFPLNNFKIIGNIYENPELL